MKMSLKEGEAYAALRGQVATQIQEMKAPISSLLRSFLRPRCDGSEQVCLESQAARQHERQWLKNQTMGELDESRLVAPRLLVPKRKKVLGLTARKPQPKSSGWHHWVQDGLHATWGS